MRIDSYSFGKIVVDGVTYTSDVIILEERVNSSWWRKKSHILTPNDLEEAVRAKPDLLVIGTGFSGVMRVPRETQDFLKSKGIDIVIQRTEEACKTYNETPRGRRAVAALHLTC